ncbi:hypothetical protein RFI_13789 [Reticulomyxa filosa]|uniref:Uncharacterized protein n=1 Tax=Reticulomyxa filosa TaxID=46433 RepID=X6NC03_RETFI|nr:hypothetical protein RFI_13789 [Reticulomyxa filosa]|eukprot:ETO23393.1 hypothetical protein RFI_13789 [Reticulomyxa filosa]
MINRLYNNYSDIHRLHKIAFFVIIRSVIKHKALVNCKIFQNKGFAIMSPQITLLFSRTIKKSKQQEKQTNKQAKAIFKDFDGKKTTQQKNQQKSILSVPIHKLTIWFEQQQ